MHYKPDPDDFIKVDDDMTLEGSYVVTVSKQVDENGLMLLKPIARHGYGSKKPDDAAIKWCIYRYQGDTATVAYEYGLTL